MGYRQNYLANDIRDTIRMAMILMTGAFQDKYKQPKFLENAAGEAWKRRYVCLVDAGKMEKAENELLNQYEIEKVTGLDTRETKLKLLELYQYMNEKEDDFLEAHHFEREEIRWGVEKILSEVYKSNV